jgi:dihydroorotate dehydrogenase electron transfer subunit
MVWVPEVGEFPMSLSLSYGSRSSIVVKAVGEGSRNLFNRQRGELVGIRGPYGNSFDIPEDAKKILLVGGGTGIAPILKLVEELEKRTRKVRAKIVIGARSGKELPFLSFLGKCLGSKNVYPTTDDGSVGFSGFAHERVSSLIEENTFDLISCCGPEAMMLQVFNLAKKNAIPAQFSLERIMKCGIAICGSCCIQDFVLCRDGPVLTTEQLSRLSMEFGKLERDKTGTLVPKS